MRSLPHETVIARTWARLRHETWIGATVGVRRARLRRLIRQGLYVPAERVRRAGVSAADEQVPADHEHAEPQQQARLPDPAGIATT
jgi:hypothetical protein